LRHDKLVKGGWEDRKPFLTALRVESPPVKVWQANGSESCVHVGDAVREA